MEPAIPSQTEPADPLDALRPEDRQWLDEMADVLPRSMPVDGSSWGTLTRVDPAVVTRAVR